MTLSARLGAVLLSVLLASCDYPRDADGTLDRIRSEGVLRVGISERPPWVVLRNGEPAGVEPRLVREFAESLKAKIAWTRGTESSLIAALKERQLDLVIGGYDASSHWASEVAASQPYVDSSIVIAAPDASSGPVARSGDVAIQYASDRPGFAAWIAKDGFHPQPMRTPRAAPTAIYDFEAEALGLEPTGIQLGNRKLVMFVAPGESRFLYALDRFLASRSRSEILHAERGP